MGVISGKGGAVDSTPGVRDWSITSEADLQAYVNSATKGGTSRVEGNEDWSGQYNAHGHTPAVMPGASFTFKGSINGTVGCASAASGAIVDRVEIRIDIESAAIIDHTVQFSANGALTIGASVAADATVPDPPTSKGTKVQTAAAIAIPAFTDLVDVRTMTITITSDNKPYVDSESSGQVKRTAGNIDCEVALTVYADDFADLPAVNGVIDTKVFVNATEFWHFKWLRVSAVSDMAVGVESADNVSAAITAAMEGFTAVDGTTPTEGFIKDPAAATFWPV